MKRLLSIFLALSLFFSSAAQAAQGCTSKVSYLWVDKEGTAFVLANFKKGDYISFCNINQSWKGVAPSICATWITLVRSALARQTEMIFYYDEPTIVNCDSLPGGRETPSPFYVLLVN